MKRAYNKLVGAWCNEEIAALQAKGANEDLLTEPAFAALVLRNVLSKHQNEIRADGDLAEAMFMAFFEKASPSDFRHLAAKDREKGNSALAYFLSRHQLVRFLEYGEDSKLHKVLPITRILDR